MKPLSFFILLVLTSCGYQFDNISHDSRKTICVPYALGDHQGDLTTQVIHLLASSGKFLPVSSGGRYQLNIYLLNSRNENVGFRYDVNQDGALTNTLVPQETRTSLLVEIDLYDRFYDCTVIGPAKVSASTVYDHEWYSSPNAINVFSLGQVNDYSDARDGALFPLNQKLAQKIVDLVLHL